MFSKDKVDHRSVVFLISVMLLLVVFVPYAQTGWFDFVNYDDPTFTSGNRFIRNGITYDGVRAIFTNPDYLCMQISLLSHMLDCHLFGLNAGGHHLTNLLLHSLNVLLLFFVLNRMTGRIWRSAGVACLFAIHPLNVESVAWIAERRNLLSTLFFFTTLWAYLRYITHPGRLTYTLVILFFVLGLMSKSMVVTLPFVLLLLDYWPLNRILPAPQGETFKGRAGSKRFKHLGLRIFRANRNLIFEKIPLVALSLIASGLTLLAAQNTGDVKGIGGLASWEAAPFALRIANALVSYASYLLKMLWPFNLSMYYVFPRSIPYWQIVGSASGILIITRFVLKNRCRWPWLPVGWFWYLGTLVPVIGIVQMGSQALADRYAYLPLIGMFIAIVWHVADSGSRRPAGRKMAVFLTAGVLLALVLTAWMQTRHWENSIRLFERAYLTTQPNYVIHNNLGVAFLEGGQADRSIDHFKEALRLQPEDDAAQVNLGDALYATGRLAESSTVYKRLLAKYPRQAVGHNNYGMLLSGKGDTEKAIDHYQKAIEIDPFYVEARTNLGNLYARKNRLKEAAEQYSEAIQIDPQYADAYTGMGAIFVKAGRLKQAIPWLRKALEINPASLPAQKNLEEVEAAVNADN